jgi:hypothetical protein
MFRFHKTYFLLFLFLFWFEVLIALFVHDDFVRPYVGDFLVVMLLYCFTRSFLNLNLHLTLFLVLAFAFTLEIAQYFSLVHHLGLQDYPLANTIIGNTFEWQDLLAYTFGAGIIFFLEQFRLQKALVPKRRS